VKPLLSLSMWVLFVAGLTGCVDSRHLVHGTQPQHTVPRNARGRDDRRYGPFR
jgi:hypothetical protein